MRMSIAKALKEEIAKVSKKAVHPALTKLRKVNTALKRKISEHRRRIAALEKEVRSAKAGIDSLGSAIRKVQGPGAAVPAGKLAKARPTAKMVRALRKRLHISQAKMAKLLGVSPMTVYNWERKSGRLQMRPRPKSAFMELRGIGVREAKARLAQPTGVKARK